MPYPSVDKWPTVYRAGAIQLRLYVAWARFVVTLILRLWWMNA